MDKSRPADTDRSSETALEDLMRAAQQGDSKAYEALLAQVAARMRGFVRGRAPWMTKQDCEDMVQDILLALHAARATWDPTRPFLPWMVTIARNRMADNARRYSRRAVFDVKTEDLSGVFSDRPTHASSDSVVNFMSVQSSMDCLSVVERRAFEMVRLRDMSMAEAAQETGSTVAAVKVALHRATSKLRTQLSNKE